MESGNGNKQNQDEIRARGGVEILCDLLHRFANNVGVLISASATLGSIALDNTENQNAIREAGGIDRLCDAMKAFPENEELKEKFCIAMGNLAKDNTENQNAIREAGAIPLIVGMVDEDETLPE